MPDAAARRTRVGPLYELLANTYTLEEFLAELAGLAVDEIDRQLSCGLTAWLEGKPVTIASSNDLAEALDDAQYAAGDGPCLHALTTGEPVEVTDLANAEAWGTWRTQALAHGVTRSLSVPLTSTDAKLGALNLYSTSPTPFTDAERHTAHLFAAEASGALAVAIRLAALHELTGHLEAALTSRAVIEQAKGILMAEERCDADRAFAILRAASQQRNTKLRDVAAAIASRVDDRPRALE